MEDVKQKMSPLTRCEDPILILEDNKETQALIKGMCKQMGLETIVAENGEVGLTHTKEKSFAIYIVDLMMPVMDGKTFIRNLKTSTPDAVILVQTALDSPETIIEIMKLDVFDYIIKPIDPDYFTKVIRKSLEFKRLKDMEKHLNLNAAQKIRNQMEWLSYKEDRRITGKEYAEVKSIYNLKTSLSQGTGFGSLLTLIDLVKNMKKDAGESYSIDKQIIDLLINNYDTCSAQLKGLHDISNLLEDKFPLECSDAQTLIQAIPEMLVNIIPHLHNKNLKVTFPEQTGNCSLNLNMGKMTLIVEELFINAYKYSVPDSGINIFSHIKGGYFWLSIMNQVNEEPYGGVPKEYEKLILEPFFRLLPPDETVGNIEKFSLGLGLTVVDNIIRKHNGMLEIHDAKNHIGSKTQLCVIAQIMLPVAT